jgi:hypothetical protein
MYEDDFNEYEAIPGEMTQKMNEIIKEELNGRIKGTIEELARYREKSDNLVTELDALRREMRAVSEKHKTEIKEAIKEGERKVGLGFAVNDTVYFITSKSHQAKCDKCNGNNRIDIEVLGKLIKVECPHCSNGNVYTYEYFSKRDTITALKFYIARKDRYNKNSPTILDADWEIKALLDDFDDYKSINDLFKTIEECQAECERKNK